MTNTYLSERLRSSSDDMNDNHTTRICDTHECYKLGGAIFGAIDWSTKHGILNSMNIQQSTVAE